MLQTLDRASDKHRNLMTDFFDGKSIAEGLIIDRFGAVRTTVSVTMIGGWNGNEFRLDEEFHYEDGSVENRVWNVEFSASGSLIAQCDDLKDAVTGHANDQEVRMKYSFPVPIAGRPVSMTFDDRMYRLGENMLLERVKMTKFGIHAADLIITFRK